MLKRLSAEGVDCYLVHMPCNLAFLGMNKATDVMEAYSYDNWYPAGHSLGGPWQPAIPQITATSSTA